MVAACAWGRAEDFELAPIFYSKATPADPVASWNDRLASGELVLEGEGKAFLRSVLDALDVPVASQVMVYSKTSLQNGRISPARPRAI